MAEEERAVFYESTNTGIDGFGKQPEIPRNAGPRIRLGIFDNKRKAANGARRSKLEPVIVARGFAPGSSPFLLTHLGLLLSCQPQCPQAVHVLNGSLMTRRFLGKSIVYFCCTSLITIEYRLCDCALFRIVHKGPLRRDVVFDRLRNKRIAPGENCLGH